MPNGCLERYDDRLGGTTMNDDIRLQWQRSCLQSLLSGRPWVDPTEGEEMVRALWTIPRFQDMTPAAAAAYLATNNAVRPTRQGDRAAG
jgi:hypothetical protein